MLIVIVLPARQWVVRPAFLGVGPADPDELRLREVALGYRVTNRPITTPASAAAPAIAIVWSAVRHTGS
jgi:hypothetical protein